MPMAEEHHNLTASEEKRLELPNTHTQIMTRTCDTVRTASPEVALHARLDIEF